MADWSWAGWHRCHHKHVSARKPLSKIEPRRQRVMSEPFIDVFWRQNHEYQLPYRPETISNLWNCHCRTLWSHLGILRSISPSLSYHLSNLNVPFPALRNILDLLQLPLQLNPPWSLPCGCNLHADHKVHHVLSEPVQTPQKRRWECSHGGQFKCRCRRRRGRG